MKNLYKNKRQEGFTIIEVLIVLAIAALILLIVFLAVPALQRNSRNNSTRQEAADILAGVNDFVANNNGSLPSTVICTNGVVDITGATGTNASTTKVRGGTICNNGTALPTDSGHIVIYFQRKCNSAGTNADTNITPRAFAALFNVENGGSANNGLVGQCLES